MLEKLLPSLFKKRINQKQNLLRENQPSQLNQEKKSNDGSEVEPGFNLVSTPQRLELMPKYVLGLMSVIRNFIILLSVAFGVMLFVNFIVVTIISFQKVLQEKNMLEIDKYGDVEERARTVDAKTVAYKKFSNEREKIYPKVEFIMDNIEPGIEVTNLNVSPSSFSISFSGRSALDFTNLIVKYLDSGFISDVIIRSASLDKTENVFKVVLDGNFK